MNLSNNELIDARVAFMKNGTAYYDAKRVYENVLYKFVAVCCYGQRDPNESFTLYEKYPGRVFHQETFEEVLTVVADVVAWTFERENRDVEQRVEGTTVLCDGVPVPADDYDAEVRRAFRALIDAAKGVPSDAPVWTRFDVDELPNTYFQLMRGTEWH